ncbi:MAG TPA: hypothetical protein VN667_12100 [Burkholderiales bacterium]|nr:hypothetical protein [Burkholderiales bacterium]
MNIDIPAFSVHFDVDTFWSVLTGDVLLLGVALVLWLVFRKPKPKRRSFDEWDL